MAIASVSDVQVRLGRDLLASETSLVEVLLEDAEAIILSELPTLYSKIDAGTLSDALVIMVEAAMVRRVLNNMDGIRQQSAEAYSVTLDINVASGYLMLTNQDRQRLGIRGSAFTIAPAIVNPALTEGAQVNSTPPGTGFQY